MCLILILFTLPKLDDELDLTDWVEKITAINDDAYLNAKAIPCFMQKGEYSNHLIPQIKTRVR